METTHLLLARQTRLERALEHLLLAVEGSHPDTWPIGLVQAVQEAREVLDD